jgi:uncharacterized repeat protein (TIGR03803 family)
MQFDQIKRRAREWAAASIASILALPPAAGLAEQTLTVLYTPGPNTYPGALERGAGVVFDMSGKLVGKQLDYILGDASPFFFKVAPNGRLERTNIFPSADGRKWRHGSEFFTDSKGNAYADLSTINEKEGGPPQLFRARYAPDGTLSVYDGPSVSVLVENTGEFYGTGCDYDYIANELVCSLYKVDASGKQVILHKFADGSDGFYPNGALITGGSGAIFGTTQHGRAGPDCFGGFSCGTVFRYTQAGEYSVLHSFPSFGGDGYLPQAGLLALDDGRLYGTTQGGGGSGCGGSGCGTLFRIASAGTYAVVHSFTGGAGGSLPNGRLIADKAGNLYGTTAEGGAFGKGTIFRLSPAGGHSVLYSFCSLPSCSDGAYPKSGLIVDKTGNLYGTAGIIFKLAGTGFVTATPFASLNASLSISYGPVPGTLGFARLGSSLVLGTQSNGIRPLEETVTIDVAGFKATLPPKSFKLINGIARFDGTISGVALTASIAQTGAMSYAFNATARGTVSINGKKDPVPVVLTIGDDRGTASVDAVFGTP